MKNLIFIFLSFISLNKINAQGLEGIIVEKYYITDKADSKFGVSDYLPAKSVTYRVFIDMKPGYRLQSVYGSPGHELKLSTSTFFYNHPIYGSYIPNLVVDENLGLNTVLLDSWIGVGAGSQLNYAVLKVDDDTSGTVINKCSPQILQSKNPLAGIPIKIKDGLLSLADLPPRVTQVGLDSLLSALDKKSTPGKGFTFVTENGAWGCIGGSSGADSLTNRVCIGQFTTNGDFYFEFNIQIGSPEFGVEQYVAKNPTKQEILNPELIISIPSGKKD